MPTTEVNLPSGRTMKVQHPAGASTEDILEFAQSEYSVTTDEDNLLIEAGKTFVAGGVQAAINTGAGVAQTYSMMLGPEADTSDEAIREVLATKSPAARMGYGKIKQHRLAKNRAVQTVNDNAHKMRELSNSIDERFNIDPEFAGSTVGQVVRGLGQVPVTLAAAAVGGVPGVVAASAPQMMTEAINDAERTLGKKYSEMDDEERSQVAISSAGYMTLGTALETAGFLKSVPGLKRFLTGKGKLPSGTIKGLAKEVGQGFAAEGFTESAQGQLLDSFARATYDDDRELMSMEVLGRRFNEFLVGGFVGGFTAGGVGTFERAATGTLFQPRTEAQAPADPSTEGLLTYEIKYVDETTGTEMSIEIEADNPGEARSIAAQGLGMDPEALEVNTLFPAEPEAEPEVTTEPEVTPEPEVEPEIEPEITPEPELTPEPEVIPEPEVTPEPEVMPEPEPTVAPVRTQVAEFKFTKDEGKPDPKYIGGAAVDYANDFSRAVRISPKAKVFKKVRTRLKEQYNLTDSQLDALRTKANKKLLEQRRAGEPLSLDMTTELPSPAPVARPAVTPQVTPEPEVTPTAPEQLLLLPDQDAPVLSPRKDEPTVGAARRVIQQLRDAALPIFNKVKAQQEVTSEESRQLAAVADQYKPATRREIPEPETTERMKSAHKERKAKGVLKRDLVGTVPAKVQEGQEVSSRLDIPSYNEADTWTVTIHEPASANPRDFTAGDVIGYDSTMYLTDATFGIGSEKRGAAQTLAITKGAGKGTIATIRGKYKQVPPEEAKQLADQFDADPAWTQVGMDPERRNYFYNREDGSQDFMREVIAADEVLQIGPVVLAKNVEYGPTPKNEFVSRLAYEIEGEPVDSKTGEEASDGQITTLSKNAVEAVVGAPQIKTTRPQPLSDVTPADIIDIEALVEDIVENDIPVWFWYADQLGRGDFTLPNTGETIQMDAGPSFALKPANRAEKKIWATSKSAKEINKKIALLKYTDKDGNEQTGYIFIVSGAPKSMHLFNVNVVRAFLRNAFGDKSFSEVKEKMLGLKPTKDIRQVLEDYDSFDAILESPDRKKFVDGLIAQGAKKKTPLKEYLESVGFFNIDPSDLIDGFFRANEFKINDVLLVLKPSYAVDGQNDHSTYSNTVYGDVEGVPDKNVDAYLLMPESVRKEKPITLEPAKAAQVISPYGIHGVRKIQKLDPTQEAERKASVGAAQQRAAAQNATIGDAVTVAESTAEKIGAKVQARTDISRDAQYNYETRTIEYNPDLLAQRGQDGAKAAMREEVIHATMHKVLMNRAKGKTPRKAFEDFFQSVGKSMTAEQRSLMEEAYGATLDETGSGAEYTRFLIQEALYGRTTEATMASGPAFEKVKSLIKSVQAYASRIFGKDLEQNREVAFVIADSIRLLQSFDPESRPVNQKIVSKAEKIAAQLDGTAEVDTDVITNAANTPSKKKDLTAFDKYIFTATSVMQRISPELSRLFKQFFFRVEKQKLEHLNRVKPFIKKYNGIKNKKDKRRLKQLLYYSPDLDPRSEDVQVYIKERTALLRKYGMLNDYNLRIRPVLNIIRTRANQEGMEVPYLRDYFPRRILDLDKIREYYGKVVVKDFSSYIESINEQRRAELDPKKKQPIIERGSREEALEFDKYIRSGEYTKRGVKPRNVQQRTIEFIDEDIIDAYADPGEAIETYINSMVLATETMRLLGRRYEVEGENVRTEQASELGRTIQRLIAEGKIDEEQAFKTIPQFARIILNPVMKENELLGAARSLSYFTLLVEPTTTLSQLFDLPFQMYDKGFLPVLSAALGKKTFRLADVGIDNKRIAAEFRNEKKWLDDAVRIGLQSTGFTRLDQLMKETGLNANYNNFRKLARGYYKNRTSNASQKFKTEMDFMFGQDADAAIAAFKKGDRNNPLVLEALRNKLLETQPISRMEMPLIVSQNPNTRALYTMKSFMVTQLNLVINKMLSNMFGKNKTKQQRLSASADLAKLMFFMVAIGMPVDFLKDLLAGRLVYMSDYVFNGIFRVAGISRYTTYTAKKEGIGQAAFDYVTPVGIQQAVDITAEIQRVASGQRAITDSKLVTLAPFSDVINRVFGFSQEREKREYKRRAREREYPTFIPPGAM